MKLIMILGLGSVVRALEEKSGKLPPLLIYYRTYPEIKIHTNILLFFVTIN